jgi:uncharacterized membrane protein
MNTHEEAEIKKEFQLERVILFSDAVFAIIITIMVLDIRLPDEFRNADAKKVQRAFAHLVPKVMAYSISFFLVARFWGSHLKMFSLLKDYDAKLLRYNLFYLFSISFFPFGISLISGGFNSSSPQYAWAAYIYVAILLMSLFTQTLLARYLVNNRHKLCFDTDNLDKILKYRALRLNFFMLPAVVAVIIGLTFMAANPLFVLLTFILYGLIMRRIRKSYYPEEENNGPILSRLFRPRKVIHLNRQSTGEPGEKS